MYLSYLFKENVLIFGVVCDARSISPLRVLCRSLGWRRQMAWACWDVDTKGVMGKCVITSRYKRKRRTVFLRERTPLDGRWEEDKVTKGRAWKCWLAAGFWADVFSGRVNTDPVIHWSGSINVDSWWDVQLCQQHVQFWGAFGGVPCSLYIWRVRRQPEEPWVVVLVHIYRMWGKIKVQYPFLL